MGTVPKRVTPGIHMYGRNSDLRGRLNDRHRFATFIMGERARSAGTARCARERPHMDVRAGGIGHGCIAVAMIEAVPDTRIQPFSLSLSPRLQTTDERYLHGEFIHELLDLCLFSTRRELSFPKQALRTHDMQDEDLMPIKTIEEAAGRLDNLTITGSF